MSRFRLWFLALRTRTLGISVTPVITGSGLAWAEISGLDWVTALATLVAASMIQIGTNLYNDAADFERHAVEEHPGVVGVAATDLRGGEAAPGTVGDDVEAGDEAQELGHRAGAG